MFFDEFTRLKEIWQERGFLSPATFQFFGVELAGKLHRPGDEMHWGVMGCWGMLIMSDPQFQQPPKQGLEEEV